MNNRLPSGSFLPSGLLGLDQEQDLLTAFNSTFNNSTLKAGIITEAYEIDDDNNLSKACIEYDVLVSEQRDQSAPTPITYKNCVMMDMFGGFSDFIEYRLRKQKNIEKREKDGAKISRLQDGSAVLILCLNGFNENGIIVGGLKHPKRKSKLTKDAGHALMMEFNGLGLTVDKDGALTVSFAGATDHAGKPLDSKVSGSFVKIKKDGSVEVSDGKKEVLALDKTKETTTLTSGKEMTLDSGKAMTVNVGDTMTVKTAKDLILAAQGSANFKMKDLRLESEGPLNIKGASLEMNIDGVSKIKASQITLDGMTFLGGAGGSPALTMNSMWIATGTLGIPIVISGPPISGLSSKVFIAD